MVPEARDPCVPPAPGLNTRARGARRSPPRLQRRRPAWTRALEAPDAARLAPGRSRGRGPRTRHSSVGGIFEGGLQDDGLFAGLAPVIQASVASSSAGHRRSCTTGMPAGRATGGRWRR